MATGINHQLFFPPPSGVVREGLTKAELMTQWLMGNFTMDSAMNEGWLKNMHKIAEYINLNNKSK